MPSRYRVAKWIAKERRKDERGYLCRGELPGKIAGMALEPGYFECLAELPAELIEQVRQMAAHPASHPEDVFLWPANYGLFIAAEEYDEAERRRRLEAYWRARVQFEHFYPDRPFTIFEPIRRIGVADEATTWDGSVVLFGIQDWYYATGHPVLCIPPSGGLIVTSGVPDHHVGLKDQREKFDALKSLVEPGLFLGSNVRSPSEVPPGTEVWVDRTLASEILPLADVKRFRPGRGDGDPTDADPGPATRDSTDTGPANP